MRKSNRRLARRARRAGVSESKNTEGGFPAEARRPRRKFSNRFAGGLCCDTKATRGLDFHSPKCRACVPLAMERFPTAGGTPALHRRSPKRALTATRRTRRKKQNNSQKRFPAEARRSRRQFSNPFAGGLCWSEPHRRVCANNSGHDQHAPPATGRSKSGGIFLRLNLDRSIGQV